MRMHLFRRAPDDHIFLLGVHHIVGDFWSLVLVIEEMQALYPAECDGRPAALPAPARQYRDFVRWQAELLAGPEGERLWEYWERQLAGAPMVLDLPTDRPRPPVFSRRGGAVPWRLAPDLVRRLKALAASEGDHALRGAAGRVPGAARPVHRPGGFPGRLPVRRPEPARIRGRDRLLHQHAAPPRRPVGRPALLAACSAASVPPCSTPCSTRTIRSPCWWSG